MQDMLVDELFRELSLAGFDFQKADVGQDRKVYFYSDGNILVLVDEATKPPLEGKVNAMYFACTISGNMEEAQTEFMRSNLSGRAPMPGTSTCIIEAKLLPWGGLGNVRHVIQMLRSQQATLAGGQIYWNPATNKHEKYTAN